MTISKKSKLLTSIAIIAIGVLLVFTVSKKSPKQNPQNNPSLKITQPIDKKDSGKELQSCRTEEEVGKEIILVSKLCSNTQTWDQEIIRKHGNQRETIVPSVKQAIPEFNKQFNLLLCQFATPEQEKNIYFTACLSESDAPPGAIYVLNTETGTLMKLKTINELFGTGYSFYEVSTDQKRFVWAPVSDTGDNKILYLFDLAKDSYKKIVILSGKETLNGGRGGFAASFRINWKNNNLVTFGVFDQSKKSTNFDGYDETQVNSIFIEYRTIDL